MNSKDVIKEVPRSRVTVISHHHLQIKIQLLQLTASSIENSLVHLIKDPDDMEACLTGKENVKPSALPSAFPPTLSTKFFSAKAITLNKSCNESGEFLITYHAQCILQEVETK
jgi:hypothetical protein